MEYREVAPLKQRLDLTLALPGSKSITNRALLCAALAKGESRLFGALESQDTAVMRQALKAFQKKGKITVDLANAGTATRFLTAMACLRKWPTVITGSKRMQERPIADLVDALRQLGAKITYKGRRGCPPLEIVSPIPLIHQKEYVVRMKGDVSSQYFSALLMLGPMLQRPLRIRVIGKLVSRPYVDMTLAVMKAFGVRVTNKGYREFLVKLQAYKACDYAIEGDASAASYFYSLQYLHGGRLKFENLGPRSIQGDADYPKALARLGKGSINMNAMPDSAMTLAVTAPFAHGQTEITNVGNLRVKETDRLQALSAELARVGVRNKTTKDSIVIFPQTFLRSSSNPPQSIRTYSDHRMAMCFAVLGTQVPGVVIQDPDCVDKTYPHFWRDLELAYLSPISLGRKNLVLTG
ncbi:MAG: 3-phosphoshikimate 1-carboxyvinyltransferase, partial [Candidatus Peregrinibacteria bacterium]